jgi:hypothetical protein
MLLQEGPRWISCKRKRKSSTINFLAGLNMGLRCEVIPKIHIKVGASQNLPIYTSLTLCPRMGEGAKFTGHYKLV